VIPSLILLNPNRYRRDYSNFIDIGRIYSNSLVTVGSVSTEVHLIFRLNNSPNNFVHVVYRIGGLDGLEINRLKVINYMLLKRTRLLRKK